MGKYNVEINKHFKSIKVEIPQFGEYKDMCDDIEPACPFYHTFRNADGDIEDCCILDIANQSKRKDNEGIYFITVPGPLCPRYEESAKFLNSTNETITVNKV